MQPPPPKTDPYVTVYEGLRYFLPYFIRAVFYWFHDSLRLISPIWPRKCIKGQLMLITGAGSGIGRSSALKFAEQGVRLILWDVNEAGNKETEKMLHNLGYENSVVAMTVNLADPKAIEKAGQEVKELYGVPDLVFNNAGVIGGFQLLNCDLEKYEMTMAVNARAVLYVTNQFIHEMTQRNSGHVIALVSMAAEQAAGGLVAYSMSKCAAKGYMEATRNEMKARNFNIQFTTVYPFYVKSAMSKGVEYESLLAPMSTTDYVANRVVDAVLKEQEELYIPKWSWFYTCMKGLVPTRVADIFTEAFEVHTRTVQFEKFRQANEDEQRRLREKLACGAK